MKVAIFGATSLIAKDLIELFSINSVYECTLFARNPDDTLSWMKKKKLYNNYEVVNYSNFSNTNHYDVIINFVGVGDPEKAKKMGSEIFDLTFHYDMMVIDYLRLNSDTRYIFLSSGAVYGGGFESPVSNKSVATIEINHLSKTDWYAIAKLYAEVRHRSLSEYSIIDVRVFNYFSHSQNLESRFFITDLVRSLKNKEPFITSSDNIVRDFITPVDFHSLLVAIIDFKPINIAIDCYTKSPVDKFTLLAEMEDKFDLNYRISNSSNSINATGVKLNYYSLRRISEKIGYLPKKTSLEGIVEEINYL